MYIILFSHMTSLWRLLPLFTRLSTVYPCTAQWVHCVHVQLWWIFWLFDAIINVHWAFDSLKLIGYSFHWNSVIWPTFLCREPYSTAMMIFVFWGVIRHPRPSSPSYGFPESQFAKNKNYSRIWSQIRNKKTNKVSENEVFSRHTKLVLLFMFRKIQ